MRRPKALSSARRSRLGVLAARSPWGPQAPREAPHAVQDDEEDLARGLLGEFLEDGEEVHGAILLG